MSTMVFIEVVVNLWDYRHGRRREVEIDVKQCHEIWRASIINRWHPALHLSVNSVSLDPTVGFRLIGSPVSSPTSSSFFSSSFTFPNILLCFYWRAAALPSAGGFLPLRRLSSDSSSQLECHCWFWRPSKCHDAPRMLHGCSTDSQLGRCRREVPSRYLQIYCPFSRAISDSIISIPEMEKERDGGRKRRKEEEEEGGRGGRKRRKKEEEILIKLEECCEGCCEGCCERFRWRCRGRFDRSMQSWWRSLTDDFWPVTFKATPPVTIQSIFNESIIDNNGPSMSSWSNQQSVASSSQTSSMKS